MKRKEPEPPSAADAASASTASCAASSAAAASASFNGAAACGAFDALWESVPVRHRGRFRDHVYTAIVGGGGAGDGEDPYEQEAKAEPRLAALEQLHAIAVELRDRPGMVVSGGAPGEACSYPDPDRASTFSGCTEGNSVFIDSFLYDDDEVDELYTAEPPKISRAYCPDPAKPKDCVPLSAPRAPPPEPRRKPPVEMMHDTNTLIYTDGLQKLLRKTFTS